MTMLINDNSKNSLGKLFLIVFLYKYSEIVSSRNNQASAFVKYPKCFLVGA